ncbi:hypothetical protein M0805_000684 [Coniferiporia weirii]|nr:hypothetical protein M0805_000684 [Coniferiporia weirii]
MPTLTKEQIRHEVINLSKTLKLLERSVDEEDWEKYATSDRSNKWLKAQSVLSGINYCRGILLNVTPNDYDFGLGENRQKSGGQFHDDAQMLLDRLERIMIEINQELKPRRRRLNPVLPTLPAPSPENIDVTEATMEEEQGRVVGMTAISNDGSMPGEHAKSLPTDLLLEPPDLFNETSPDGDPTRLANPSATLLPHSLGPTSAPSNARPSGVTPNFLQTSTALQEDLSSQLAQMARQLRVNAQHFSETLAKDQDVVQSAQEKLERNYDDLTKERVRLRDHSGKSGGTTCLVLLSIMVAIAGFMMTFFIIRVT